jgi:hypothetical protein
MPSSYCYGLIVQGGLLRHGHDGSEVDEAGSGDEFPLGQSTKKGLQVGSLRNGGWRRWKNSSINLSVGFGRI